MTDPRTVERTMINVRRWFDIGCEADAEVASELDEDPKLTVLMEGIPESVVEAILNVDVVADNLELFVEEDLVGYERASVVVDRTVDDSKDVDAVAVIEPGAVEELVLSGKLTASVPPKMPKGDNCKVTDKSSWAHTSGSRPGI